MGDDFAVQVHMIQMMYDMYRLGSTVSGLK